MTTQNLTDWFNLSEQEPWEPGVYGVRLGNENFVEYEQQLGQWFSYWDGYRFSKASSSIFGADKYAPCVEEDGFTVTRWRGLSSRPNAKPAPEPKPKARGNRKVTRYVVMVGYGFQSTYPVATFEFRENALAYIDRESKSTRYETIYLDKIRFRTPEAD